MDHPKTRTANILLHLGYGPRLLPRRRIHVDSLLTLRAGVVLDFIEPELPGVLGLRLELVSTEGALHLIDHAL